MQKLLLNSIWVATVLLPVLAARENNATKGLKKAIVSVIAFNVFYLFYLRFLY